MRKDTKETPVRYCEYCGRKLERNIYPSKIETLNSFNKRKYCNRICMRKAYLSTGEGNQKYSSAHESARKINDLLLNKKTCELCGKSGKMDVHHKDENYKNNEVENLQVLCRSCHMKIHRPKRICKVDGCESKVKGYGYCEKHYQRFKKYGSPNITWGKVLEEAKNN